MKIKIEQPVNEKTAPVEKSIFLPSVISIVAIILFMILFEGEAKSAISAIFSYVTDQLGFVYIWAGALSLGAVTWIGFGKYSNVRLGGPDARPEFKRLSWMAMFFCSAIPRGGFGRYIRARSLFAMPKAPRPTFRSGSAKRREERTSFRRHFQN